MTTETTARDTGVPGPAAKKPRRWLPWAIGSLVALGFLGKSLFGAASAEERVSALCSQIRPGLPVAQLAAFARENGLGLSSPGEGLNYLPDKASMGRHLCRVQVKGGAVETSSYLFLD